MIDKPRIINMSKGGGQTLFDTEFTTFFNPDGSINKYAGRHFGTYMHNINKGPDDDYNALVLADGSVADSQTPGAED